MSQMKAQVNKLLTGVSSGYVPMGYISEKALPVIKSAQYSGLLGKYGTSHLRIESSLKGGRGKFRRVEAITRLTTAFLIQGHGLEGFVSKEDYRNVEDPFDAERDEVIGLSTLLWLEKEKAFADTVTSTAVMTQNETLAGVDQWSDYANSAPVDKITEKKNHILDASGAVADTLMMDIVTFNKLRYHPQILDALGYKYARPGGVTGQELADALGLKRVLIAEARYESAAEGQTSDLAPVWGKHAVLAALPEQAQVMQKSLGYMVRLTDGQPRKVYKEDAFNPPGSSKILVEDEYDMLISDALSGYLLKDVIA